MKQPHEYLLAAGPEPLPTPTGPVVPLAQAEAAVALALADAENYRALLLRAVRNATPFPFPNRCPAHPGLVIYRAVIMEHNQSDHAAHILPGETLPACNRCQYVARSAKVATCPYCGGNWTHDVTRPPTSASPADVPAPDAAKSQAGERLRQIRERLDAASPGPWEINSTHLQVWAPQDETYIDTCTDLDEGNHNATFIAHAPEDIRYLLGGLHVAEAWAAELGRTLWDAEHWLMVPPASNRDRDTVGELVKRIRSLIGPTP